MRRGEAGVWNWLGENHLERIGYSIRRLNNEVTASLGGEFGFCLMRLPSSLVFVRDMYCCMVYESTGYAPGVPFYFLPFRFFRPR